MKITRRQLRQLIREVVTKDEPTVAANSLSDAVAKAEDLGYTVNPAEKHTDGSITHSVVPQKEKQAGSFDKPYMLTKDEAEMLLYGATGSTAVLSSEPGSLSWTLEDYPVSFEVRHHTNTQRKDTLDPEYYTAVMKAK